MNPDIYTINIDDKSDLIELIDNEPINNKYVIEFYDSLMKIGSNIETVSKSIEPEKENEKRVIHISFNLEFNDVYLRYFLEPNSFSDTIFFEYDILDEMILESTHPILGGDYDEDSDDINAYLEETRENISMEQMLQICQSTRNININTYEQNICNIASSFELPIEYDLFKIGREITGVRVEHQVFESFPKNSDLYNKITKLTNIKKTYVRHIFNAYLDNGLRIPENINSNLDSQRNENDYNKRSIGFQ